MYTTIFALIAGASAHSSEVQGASQEAIGVSPEVQGISCYSDGSCPWYCVGCKCCSGTCWFGAGITNCKNMECELCKATASAALSMGSEAACDAGADAACMAAGGAFVDPIADALCPTLVVPLCHVIFGAATQPTADAACEAIGMCSGSEDSADEVLFDEVGRRIGYPYAVCARQDEDWTWDAAAEDVNPNCATFFPTETHGCHTLWMKENCAGTCRRCPGARTINVDPTKKDKDL